MRVPADPTNPSFDATFKVGFWQWFTSSKVERIEWARRRQAAIHTMPSIRKLKAADEWAGRKAAEQDAKRQAKRNK